MGFRIVSACVLALVLVPTDVFAHCDTLNGPVVADARYALASGDITPVLKWVKADDEAEVHRAFADALRVRVLGPKAQEVADRFFFETLVRLHRAGEGAPYSGLRESEPEPVIRLTDEALSSGSAENLIGTLNAHLKIELMKRFEEAKEARKDAKTSVEAGRRYVSAYVELTHFVERVHGAGVTSESHGQTQQGQQTTQE